MPENLGRTVRGYRLVERLGAGAAGVVYRGQALLGGEDVAVKMIQPAFANHPEYLRRFESEARLSQRLTHPNILPLLDYWRDASGVYLITRLLPGTLRAEIARYPHGLPLERVLRLLQQIAGALGQAHALGILHRDIKPSNILLDDRGTPYLADFGLAQPVDGVSAAEDVPQGSPLYLAPELIQGRAPSPRSDQYALAILLYEMLTGQPPFQAENIPALLVLHLRQPLPPLAARAPWLPPALDLVLARAAAKEPARRYPSVDDFAADFARVIYSAQDDDVPGILGMGRPYPGLRPFSRAQAPFYFGREAVVEQVLRRMQPGPLASLVVICGPAGSGATSLLEAGIVPALAQGRVMGAQRWHLRRWQPPAAAVLDDLATLLASLPDAPQPTEIAALLVHKQAHLGEMIERWLLPEEGLALLVDDLAPLLTCDAHAAGEAQRALLLLSARGAPRLRVVALLPAELLGQALALPALGTALQDCLVLLPALTLEEIERAVAGPAQRLGIEVERDFIAAVQAAMRTVPDPLPRMQFALAAAYALRDGPRLNLGHLLRVGGLENAIAQAAEATYERLSVAERRALPVLVRVFFGSESCEQRLDAARLQALEAQHPGLRGAVDALLRLGLLYEEGGLLQCASPAVLRAWPRLFAWYEEALSADITALRQREREQARRASAYGGLLLLTALGLLMSVLLLAEARRTRNLANASAPALIVPAQREATGESARLARAAAQAQAEGRRGLALALTHAALDYSPQAEIAYEVALALLAQPAGAISDAVAWQAALLADPAYRVLTCDERLLYRVLPLCAPGTASP